MTFLDTVYIDIDIDIDIDIVGILYNSNVDQLSYETLSSKWLRSFKETWVQFHDRELTLLTFSVNETRWKWRSLVDCQLLNCFNLTFHTHLLSLECLDILNKTTKCHNRGIVEMGRGRKKDKREEVRGSESV